MTQARREFLKKSLKLGAGAGAVTIGASYLNAKGNKEQDNGVVQGKSTKKEVLYYKSEAWEKFYKIAY